MKKMMLAAATLAAGVAMADIVSSDIVGYTTKTLADDKQAVSVGFIEVGGAGFNLTSLKLDVTGSCSGDIYIEILDTLGYTTQTYYWYQNAFGRDDGWYNDDDDKIGEDVDDIVFTPGTGLWLTGLDGEGLTTAGKVIQADISIALADDKQMIGNPYAAPIGLVANVEIEMDGSCSGDVYIEMLDSLGYTTQTYYWYQNAFGRDDGWYNDDDDKIGDDVDDVVFPAGQGLWVTGMDEANFNITSPIPAN